ncbi:hypothetical protein [Amycolatopsis suaedae]|uniref:Uncharacterized protein n=1 Tax=Amycolatopsis suaedae TaxID=2510978 RepID=A0A4Q7JED8_9PSEU|nr:hypothetical protein [Amycolatopsis suaedae]RZQ65859.1 hypothetical protein EWH70_01930 [Amycolatopsis suaedae]
MLGSTGESAETLVSLACSARDTRVSGMARAAIEAAWAEGGQSRDRVWRAVWALLESARLGWPNHQDDDRVRPLLLFLLAPDPAARYEPRVRLHTCLPDSGGPEVGVLVDIAVSGEDAAVREPLADLLRTTGHPRLLAELAEALRRRRAGTQLLTDDGYVPAAITYGAWNADGEPGPLLRILLDNPHLERPSRVPDMALVLILRDRFDLLRAFAQAPLARILLGFLATAREPIVETMPEQVLDGSRRALREISPGAGQDLVCRRAIAGDVEAAAAVRDAGLRPADPLLTPLLLYLTGQWDSLDGDLLFAALPLLTVDEAIDALTRLLEMRDVPAEAAGHLRAALRAIPRPSGSGDLDYLWEEVTDTICALAVRGNPEARSAVLDAGYRPTTEEGHPAFLFLTEQWEAYDRLDPDGTLLTALFDRPYLLGAPPETFREIAERAGRPDPVPPPRPDGSRRRAGHGGTHHSDYTGFDGGGYDGGGGYSGGGF